MSKNQTKDYFVVVYNDLDQPVVTTFTRGGSGLTGGGSENETLLGVKERAFFFQPGSAVGLQRSKLRARVHLK